MNKRSSLAYSIRNKFELKLALNFLVLLSACVCFSSCADKSVEFKLDRDALENVASDVLTYWANHKKEFPKSIDALGNSYARKLSRKYKLVFIHSEKTSIYVLMAVPLNCSACEISKTEIDDVRVFLEKNEDSIRSMADFGPYISWETYRKRVDDLRRFLPPVFFRDEFTIPYAGFYILMDGSKLDSLVDSNDFLM